MHRDYLYGKLSDYHFIRLHFTTIFDGITTISFWWRLKVLDNKFCHGFNSSCSGIFTFNGFNGPFQPELSERRAPCRHVTIMDLHSHILEIQLMPCHTFVLIKTRRFSFVKTLQNIQSLHSLARALLSDYHFIRLHVTTIFDGITTISFWWRLKVLDNKFCHGFNSSCSGIFTFNGFNGPFQPELSERRAPCRHVTIMDLHSHILEIQLMPCHTFVLIKTRRFSFVKTLQNIQSLHSLARALGWTCGASVADSACFTYA